jgi:7,8-dihydro-6-hydroxymethylpterin dimethyltransferase
VLSAYGGDGLSYENVFRVIVMQFLDPYNFDVRSVKRSCIHIAHPDGRIIPFDTFNMFYREGAQGYDIVNPAQKQEVTV